MSYLLVLSNSWEGLICTYLMDDDKVGQHDESFFILYNSDIFFSEIVEHKHKYSINTSHWFLNFLQIMQDCTCKFLSCSTINRKFNIVY